MPSFAKLFFGSKGKPVDYKGTIIQMMDYFPVESGQSIRVQFESVNARWRQGIALTTDGAFVLNARRLPKAIVLWSDTAPQETLLIVESKKGECEVKNVWDTGDGTIESWYNGAAMIVEETPLGRRYKCNDGDPDEDFDDIIFRIERVE